MKDRAWVLPTLQGWGSRNGGIRKDMKVLAGIREMGQYRAMRQARKTFEEERGGCGFNCSKKFKYDEKGRLNLTVRSAVLHVECWRWVEY